MYDIQVDRKYAVINVTLSGLMTSQEVDAYIADVTKGFVCNGLRTYAMVIDVSACPIQPQDVIARMGEHMAAMPKAHALAVVTGTSVAKMQIRRLFKQSYARIFSTVAEGRSWVYNGEEPAQAQTS